MRSSTLNRLILFAVPLMACGCSQSAATNEPRALDKPALTNTELAETAIHASDADSQREATVELSRRAGRLREWLSGDATPSNQSARDAMRRVFAESTSPTVRADAATTLGSLRDWQSLPALVDAMESDTQTEVQQSAATAAVQITGIDFMFRPGAPPDERQRAIARYREQIRNIEGEPMLSELYRDRAKMREFKELRAQQFEQESQGENATGGLR
ncbi:MAG: HEAT repeat domain-containing protein [Pirellulales bacterium]|nr:HEAT repeat domain-containing protein [Pirellulales bacterium]